MCFYLYGSKTMAEEKFCKGCEQSSKCQEVYRKLGSIKDPSLALKFVVAFLLPILIFIASIFVFEKIFARVTHTKGLQTLVSFLMAFLVTFGFILIVNVISRYFGKTKKLSQDCQPFDKLRAGFERSQGSG